jgi:hypothetical protein
MSAGDLWIEDTTNPNLGLNSDGNNNNNNEWMVCKW